ncbi:hypothetical protein EDB89DRAFT_2009018, partial [Lactarius sanguifluus]
TLARQWNKPTLCVDAEPTVQRKVFRSVHVWQARRTRALHTVLPNLFVFKPVEQPPANC